MLFSFVRCSVLHEERSGTAALGRDKIKKKQYGSTLLLKVLKETLLYYSVLKETTSIVLLYPL